jgi:hypothetical protein
LSDNHTASAQPLPYDEARSYSLVLPEIPPTYRRMNRPFLETRVYHSGPTPSVLILTQRNVISPDPTTPLATITEWVPKALEVPRNFFVHVAPALSVDGTYRVWDILIRPGAFDFSAGLQPPVTDSVLSAS